MYGKSNMETYITICNVKYICNVKQEANENLLYGSGTETGALYQPRGVEWVGRWEGGSKERGYMYTHG